MIRTYTGLPRPLLPPLPLPPISTDASGMHRQSFADVHQCIAEVSPKLRRCITDHLSEQSQLSPNVRRTLDYVGDALANIRQTIASQFFHRDCWYFMLKIARHREASRV